jgi:hypothetical protein
MFFRRKRSLLARILPLLAIAGVVQSFLRRRGRAQRRVSKVIGTLGTAALALQAAAPRYSRR